MTLFINNQYYANDVLNNDPKQPDGSEKPLNYMTLIPALFPPPNTPSKALNAAGSM